MYVLTRLGFGLNVVPKVMTLIVEAVLAKDEQVARTASSYIDDVLVDQDIIAVEKVVACKRLRGQGTRAPWCQGWSLCVGPWKRDRVLPEVGSETLTRCLVHQLVGE